MLTRRELCLIGGLMMFPQIAETIYSPALTGISASFGVSPQVAAQTLSCYFIAFAAGVVFWGWLCDRWGRRPVILSGLALYALASVVALLAGDFNVLLIARVIAAFGAAVGSVGTQTMLRDRLHGATLTKTFSTIGIALALSPALGLLSGSLAVNSFGYRGVFYVLFVLAIILFFLSQVGLPETRVSSGKPTDIWGIVPRMVRDPKVWVAGLLVAFFNISIFSYYALAPFLYKQNGLGDHALVYGGLVLALASILGGRVNTMLLNRDISRAKLLRLGIALNCAGALAAWHFQHGWLLLPAVGAVTMAFAIVIPIVLGGALSQYSDCRGTAGSLLGLGYYTLIGGGLAVAGWAQNLGAALAACATLSVVPAIFYAHHLRAEDLNGPQVVYAEQDECGVRTSQDRMVSQKVP